MSHLNGIFLLSWLLCSFHSQTHFSLIHIWTGLSNQRTELMQSAASACISAHESYLRILRKVASLSPERFKIAAAVVTHEAPGERMVALGLNHSRQDPFQERLKLHGKSNHLHAEMSAIKNALKFISRDQLARATLYVCRVKRYE